MRAKCDNDKFLALAEKSWLNLCSKILYKWIKTSWTFIYLFANTPLLFVIHESSYVIINNNYNRNIQVKMQIQTNKFKWLGSYYWGDRENREFFHFTPKILIFFSLIDSQREGGNGPVAPVQYNCISLSSYLPSNLLSNVSIYHSISCQCIVLA